jgi:hypothetical protein
MLVRVPVLSHLEFDLIWEELGLGERPYPITVGSFGATMTERAQLREQALAALDQRVEDLLTMLVRNQFTIDGLVLADGRQLRVLAAGHGDRGLIAVQTDDELRLEPVRGTNVVGSVVALLPEEKPGPGNPVTLARAVFADASEAYTGGGYFAFERALNQGGITGRDLRILSTLVESGRHGGGQLAANSVDRLGRRARSTVLNWFDTDAGRYLVHLERRRDGQEWLTFAPGDPSRIERLLTQLVTETGVRP